MWKNGKRMSFTRQNLNIFSSSLGLCVQKVINTMRPNANVMHSPKDNLCILRAQPHSTRFGRTFCRLLRCRFKQICIHFANLKNQSMHCHSDDGIVDVRSRKNAKYCTKPRKCMQNYCNETAKKWNSILKRFFVLFLSSFPMDYFFLWMIENPVHIQRRLAFCVPLSSPIHGISECFCVTFLQCDADVTRISFYLNFIWPTYYCPNPIHSMISIDTKNEQ